MQEGGPEVVQRATVGILQAMIYRWLTWCARHALRWCYRDVSVVGAVPATGPVLLAVNHPNDVPDICAVLVSVPRRVTFVANVTAAEHPFVRWVYGQMGVIPIHRIRDVRKARARGEDSAAANARAFAAVRDTLAAGGCVVVFPEGGVQRGPHLGALRNGLARMALDARDGGAVAGVQVVPLGLTYEAPGALRSRLLVEVGEPIALDAWRADPDRPADTQLTNRVAARLRRVTRQAPTVEAAESLQALAELAAAEAASQEHPGSDHLQDSTDASSGHGSPPMLIGTQHWQAIADDLYGPGLAPEAAADPRLDGVRALAVELDSLAALAPRWRLLLGWSAVQRSEAVGSLRSTFGRPAAWLGWVTHAPAWSLVQRLAESGADTPDDVMPRRIIPGVYLMTVWYLLLGVAVAALLVVGTAWSSGTVAVGTLLALLFLPVCAREALQWRDGREDRRLHRALGRAVPDLAERLPQALARAREGRISVPPSPPGLPSV